MSASQLYTDYAIEVHRLTAEVGGAVYIDGVQSVDVSSGLQTQLETGDGRVALVRVGFSSERCDQCGDCVVVCPEPHVIDFQNMAQKGFIASGDCLNCARCLEVCPQDAFRFTVRRLARPQRAAFERAA